MRDDITRDFIGAAEKGLKVFYNDSLGQYDVETSTETVSFYDECEDEGGGIYSSNGRALEQVKKFIAGFNRYF